MEYLPVILHSLTVALLLIIFIIFLFISGSFAPATSSSFDPFEKYGKWPAVIMYILRFLTLVPLPLSFCNFIGIVSFNTHPQKPKLKTSTLFGPFICFRVVTRGTFPELVKKNVQRNIEICSRIGLDNYIVEVVTDTAVNLPKSPRMRETVVPSTYQTMNRTMYKARALNYCLENGVNVLNDNDWIVHLDEETILTDSSVIGIINFINDGIYQFGQGVITYANEEIVNWLTTIADLVRVGMDYGMIRFSLKMLHRPLFSWKGSFIVSNAGAERSIKYDFGQEGSIAEDCFFALTAWKEGYKFGFIDGEMWEKSTFSVMDYIRQRKRWVQGIYNAICSSRIPCRFKFGISFMMLGWLLMPFTVPNVVLVPLYPLPMWRIVNSLCAFMGAVMLFLFIFGAIKSFSIRRIGICRYIMLCFVPLLIVPVSSVLETIGVIWAMYTRKTSSFHIVDKQTTVTSELITTRHTVLHV
ncbi:hypothetical protein ACJMK2_032572 [Sinanodonta woodiana]|uniref:Glycosyltransferase 2-like domain-containing protein n=1 Tax=Sinanodonta woodiana TaxID=1069815 RepID=A0ABD3X244_SINWO